MLNGRDEILRAATRQSRQSLGAVRSQAGAWERAVWAIAPVCRYQVQPGLAPDADCGVPKIYSSMLESLASASCESESPASEPGRHERKPAWPRQCGTLAHEWPLPGNAGRTRSSRSCILAAAGELRRSRVKFASFCSDNSIGGQLALTYGPFPNRRPLPSATPGVWPRWRATSPITNATQSPRSPQSWPATDCWSAPTPRTTRCKPPNSPKSPGEPADWPGHRF